MVLHPRVAGLSGVSFVGQAEYADMVSIFDFNMRPVRTPSLAPHRALIYR